MASATAAVMASARPRGISVFENTSRFLVRSTKNATNGKMMSMMTLNAESPVTRARLLPMNEPVSPQATPATTNAFTM